MESFFKLETSIHFQINVNPKENWTVFGVENKLKTEKCFVTSKIDSRHFLLFLYTINFKIKFVPLKSFHLDKVSSKKKLKK